MQCTFKGPSSLFQRWNLQVRKNYIDLDKSGAVSLPTNQECKVLLVVRKLTKAASHGMYSSRLFANEEEIISQLQEFLSKQDVVDVPVSLVVQDLAALSFAEQVKLVGSSSIVIGMHGAGIPSSMHMAIGTKYCCGVIEIFPDGEFKPIRGYGNMARRMGHTYRRMELSRANSAVTGGKVDSYALNEMVKDVLKTITKQPSCVLPSVMSNPYFD